MNPPRFTDPGTEEHVRQRARFEKREAKANAAMRALARFKRWHKKLLRGEVRYEDD